MPRQSEVIKLQELEWAEAQHITVSIDLVAAAKQQLRFLAAVDGNRNLYQGPLLHHAIRRYKNNWLPLLAQHAKTKLCKGPLVVPVDCEWIWHCHRLNPIRYKVDCEELHGEILDNSDVVSSTQSTSLTETEEVWGKLFPNEPYHLNSSNLLPEVIDMEQANAPRSTNYDLVSAVERQSSFFYQVSRPLMSDDAYLQEAVARYKGFLHLIKRNKEGSINRFCVPTYDIDLIWHSHQLYPRHYSKDTEAIYGKVLEHDDTDSDRTEGKRLDVGFLETTKQWEKTFRSRYWREGAMHQGNARPLMLDRCPCQDNNAKLISKKTCHDMKQVSEVLLTEVLLQVVYARNLPHKDDHGNPFLFHHKKQGDSLSMNNGNLSIPSLYQERQAANFWCEPTGELFLKLTSLSPKTTWTAHVSVGDVLNLQQGPSMERWVKMIPTGKTADPKPVFLYIAFSFTPPFQAPGGIINEEEGKESAETGNTYDKQDNEIEADYRAYSRCMGGCGGGGGRCSGGRCSGGSCGGGRCGGGTCGSK